ncbi:MAG: hypothetical protein ACTIKE_15820 [Sphingobacterium sp.]
MKELKVGNVTGAGGNLYHVYLDDYYIGAIWGTERFGWQHRVEHPAITERMVNRIIELIEIGEIE